MDIIPGEIVGDIHVLVCKTSDNHNFFYLQADNSNIQPVVDVIEDVLIKY